MVIGRLDNLPSITDCSHAHAIYDGTGTSAISNVATTVMNTLGWVNADCAPTTIAPLHNQAFNGRENLRQVIANVKKDIEMATKLRIVKVIIADVDENIPLDKRVLYSGEEKITDATDQELFFEIDIKNILDKHNEYRVTLKDKSIKERVENLEPVKIRDLRMVVVNVATF